MTLLPLKAYDWKYAPNGHKLNSKYSKLERCQYARFLKGYTDDRQRTSPDEHKVITAWFNPPKEISVDSQSELLRSQRVAASVKMQAIIKANKPFKSGHYSYAARQ